MPSKNSVNKPKLTENLRHKNHALARKRSERERKGLINPPRSHEDSKSGQAKSEAVDLYLKGAKSSSPITTKTLSKKRQQKIERNMKYAGRRKLLTDAQAKLEDEMEIEDEEEESKKNAQHSMKEAFWSALDDAHSSTNLCQEGEGTTLGGPFYP